MFLELFTLLLVGALTLSDNVSTKPGLKIFRDEYKSVTAACHDLGFARKPCKSDTDKKIVAFDVRLTKPIKNLAAKGRVIFGMVELNEGKGYDPSTGIFTAPVSGIYVFDWTTLAEQGKTAYTSMVVNGNYKSWNHCRSDISNIYLSCSKMTVAKLKQGNKVWIGGYTGSSNMYDQFTSFSGYKL